MPKTTTDRTIHAVYGDDARAMAKRLLEAADVVKDIPENAAVAIKPNLVVSRPASGGATTHPEIVAGIVEYLIEHGRRNLSVIEGSWVGDDTRRAFAACGYDDLAKRYGIPLRDLKSDRATSVKTPAGPVQICDLALKADYLINVPVLKGHCQTRMTCALKNLKGCIPDGEKRRFHREGLDRLIAGLAVALRPRLTVVDGICGDLDFEEGGTPVRANRMFVGRDAFRLDLLGCKLLGFESADIGYLRLAAEWGLGDVNAEDWELIELNRPAPGDPPRSSSKADRLGRGVDADQACSACYANLIHALKRLDEKGGRARPARLSIGQGWKGKKPAGLGVGECCRQAERHIGGCPPSAAAILRELEQPNA